MTKKIIRIGLISLGSLLILLIGLFFILKHNPKPKITALERIDRTDREIDSMARDLVDQMSMEEKVQMMSPWLKNTLKLSLEMVADGMKYNQHSYQAGGNERLGIPTVRFFDGPRGMVSGTATCFPVSMARAATFDRNLEYEIGTAIGKEIRANRGNYFGGVCINLLRHPAGGRAQETYGEDSYLLGQMGTALMSGVQSQNVMACIKHYAVNNQENARFTINVEADERVLREVYLAHFKECVENGAASLMGSYNKFRGDQVCENQHLLTTILRNDWNFRGFTISDFLFGIHNTENAAKAGLDIEMPCIINYGDKLLEVVKSGEIPENLIDSSSFRIARTILKFETRPDPVGNYPKKLIGSREHISLALEAAEKSMVLIKNEINVLPLEKSKIKNVLIVGRLADYANIGDHGSSRVRPEYVVTPLEGFINEYGADVNFTHTDGEDIENTKNLASKADAVVFVVGYSHDDEGEYMNIAGYQIGGDRSNIRLYEKESILLREVGPIKENSVAVLIGGSAIIVEEWKDSINGIIHAFYPGMEGGTAIARTIFGDNNPGGKLPFTIATDETHYPSFDMFADEVTYDRYHGYIKLDHESNKAAFPFGFGLSYTTFALDSMNVSIEADKVNTSVIVKNTGRREGYQVIQLYIGFDNSQVEREHKLLKGFKKINLQPGERKRVSIPCPIDKLRWYDPKTGKWKLDKMKYQVYIGTSSDESHLLFSTFEL
jgi:beta-glucosidase